MEHNHSKQEGPSPEIELRDSLSSSRLPNPPVDAQSCPPMVLPLRSA
jgi:hypothetical protein